MVSFLEYADLLPASEYKHHSTGGGLIYHSFDVAKRAMRMAQVTQFPIGTGTVADTQQSNGRWKAGTVLAALLHDGGKILVGHHNIRLNDIMLVGENKDIKSTKTHH
jgi:conjugal transfer pilus assembly protein TraI